MSLLCLGDLSGHVFSNFIFLLITTKTLSQQVWSEDGDVLQMRACAKDDILFEAECDAAFPSYPSTEVSPSANISFEAVEMKNPPSNIFIPTTDPQGILEYPHPDLAQNSDTVDSNVNRHLVYPRPDRPKTHVVLPISRDLDPASHVPVTQVEVTPGDGMFEACVPTTQPQMPETEASTQPPTQSQAWVYPDNYPHKTNSSSTFVRPEQWSALSNLSIADKLSFLKELSQKSRNGKVNPLVPSASSILKARSTSDDRARSTDERCPFDIGGFSASSGVPVSGVLTPERLDKISRCASAGSGSRNLLASQRPALDEKGLPMKLPKRRSSPSGRCIFDSRTQTVAVSTGQAGKIPKRESGVPVPMPRNLLMMEGAQSGANAVAIEMPESESYHGAACNKEEEIAASGG